MSTALKARLKYLAARIMELANAERDNQHNEALVQIIDRINNLAERNRPRRIGVVGMVAAGKSTFMNTILGHRILPTGFGSTTSIPAYISSKPGLFRGEIHFISRATIEDELKQFVELHKNGDWNTDFYKELLSRLEHLFDMNLDLFDTTAAYEALHVLPLAPPNIAVGRCCGNTDLSALDSPNLIDLVGGRPLVFECATADDMSTVINSIFCAANVPLSRVFHHIDISGPFNIPADVVIVDTPGLGDDIMLTSKRTMDTIPTLDEMWMLSHVQQAIAQRPEREAMRRAHLGGCPIHVIATHIDAIGDTDGPVAENEAVQERFRDAFMQCLNPSSRETRRPGPRYRLTEQEQDDITTASDALLQDMSFISLRDTGHPVGVEPLLRRLAVTGEQLLERTNDLIAELHDIEQNAFFHNEPSLLPPEVADAVIKQLIELLRSFNFPNLAQSIIEHCDAVWPTHKSTVKAIMRDLPGRRGFFLGSTGQFDIPMDIANKWSSHTRRAGQQAYQAFAAILRDAETLVNDDAAGENGRKYRQAANALLEQLERLRRQVMTSNVRDDVVHYMTFHNFFYRGSFGRDYLPTSDEISSITDHLLSQLNSGLDRQVEQIRTSCIFSARVYDTLTPRLRERLTEILNFNEGDTEGDDEYTFMCPISLEVMVDPVQLQCGHVLDMSSVRKCLVNRINSCYNKCPGETMRKAVRRRSDYIWRYAEYLARHHRLEEVGDMAWWDAAWLRIHGELSNRREVEDGEEQKIGEGSP